MKEINQKRFLLGILLSIFLIFATISYLLVFSIPKMAEKYFGPPHKDLDSTERIIYSFKLLINKDFLLKSNPVLKDGQLVIIEPGMSAASVSEILKTSRLISDTQSFSDYLIYKGIDRYLRSGTYLLDPQKTPIEIAADLYDETPQDIDFSFLAGWRTEEIAALLKYSGLKISDVEFLKIIQNPSESLLSLIPADIDSLEGYLSPGNYVILKTATSQDLIGQFINKFVEDLPDDYLSLLEKTGLTLKQAVILASIVEKETVLPDEAPIIASVFMNRLNAEMPLQSDPTVQYAIGYDEGQKSWWKNPLNSEDLKTVSAFNTYLITGLPPSPICNPGFESLNAVFKPAKTEYFYFRAACDGEGGHQFSRSYESHLNAACD